MMKRWPWIGSIVMAGCLLGGMAWAQGPKDRPFGVGLTLGEPSGVTGKYWFDRKNTLDFAFGWGYYPHSGPAIYGDYLYNAFTFISGGGKPFDLLLYIGVGGKFGVWNHHHDQKDPTYDAPGLGVRFPFGVTMVFNAVPFDTFFEVVPCLAFIAPDPFWFDLDVAVGGRFYF